MREQLASSCYFVATLFNVNLLNISQVPFTSFVTTCTAVNIIQSCKIYIFYIMFPLPIALLLATDACSRRYTNAVASKFEDFFRLPFRQNCESIPAKFVMYLNRLHRNRRICNPVQRPKSIFISFFVCTCNNRFYPFCFSPT